MFNLNLESDVPSRWAMPVKPVGNFGLGGPAFKAGAMPIIEHEGIDLMNAKSTSKGPTKQTTLEIVDEV